MAGGTFQEISADSITAKTVKAGPQGFSVGPGICWPFYVGHAQAVALGISDCFYWAGGIYAGVNGQTTPTIGRLLALPFFNGPASIPTTMQMVVTAGAAGGQVRFGIWDNLMIGGVPFPGPLLFDSGDQSGAAVAILNAAIANVQFIANSIYWFGCITGTLAPTFKGLQGATGAPMYAMYGTQGVAAQAMDANLGWQQVRAYGALPNPFPTVAAGTVMMANNQTHMYMAVSFP